MMMRGFTLAMGAFALAAASFVAEAADHAFSNTTSFAIADQGVATLYPSPVVVSGVSGNVSKVTVTLKGLSHTWPGDLNVLLVTAVSYDRCNT